MKTPEQSGANGKFNGTAYYRFGDVVKRVYNDPDDDNKQKTEYWVCVRPAFGPEGKSDSHWVSVSPLPAKNIEEIDIEDYHFSAPTGNGVNVEQMQNFAEMESQALRLAFHRYYCFRRGQQRSKMPVGMVRFSTSTWKSLPATRP